jgi:hypothetical protein
MKINRILQFSTIALAASLCVSTANASKEDAEDLLADLKDCKADSATMKKAQAMIKKHGGAPSEKQVDDFIDSLPNKLIDCIDNLD